MKKKIIKNVRKKNQGVRKFGHRPRRPNGS